MSNTAPVQVDYTSRDFEAIRADLINLVNYRTGLKWTADDPSDIGVALIESFAYMGDLMNYYIDRSANEGYVDTATKRQSLLDLSNLFGYRPSGPTPAKITVKFTNNSASPVDLPAGTQVMAPLQYGSYTEAFFETDTAITQLAAGAFTTRTCTEGKTANTDKPALIDPATGLAIPVSLATSTGAYNITLVLPELGIVDGSVAAYTGQGSAFTTGWTWVDSLMEWGPSDAVFTTSMNADGSTSVVFGDGIHGAIPEPGQLISASYRTSVGLAGNIAAGQIREISYIPGNLNVNLPTYVDVENVAAASGGADPDDNSMIRSKLKASISARRRAVTLTDYESLALSVPQVGRAKAVSTNPASVSLYLQPLNDGTATPGVDTLFFPTATMIAIEAAVVSYLSDKIPVNTTVQAFEPTYVEVDISITINVGAAYRQADVKNAITQRLLDSTSGLFSYASYDFGETVALSDLIVIASTVNGVVSSTVTLLDRHAGLGVADIVMAANEIPHLTAANLELTMVGGLV
jgi:hypothetical protein